MNAMDTYVPSERVRAYYESHFQELRPNAEGWVTVKSPFGNDRNASLRINVRGGAWCDDGTGERGNVFDFERKSTGCDLATAKARILAEPGRKPPTAKADLTPKVAETPVAQLSLAGVPLEAATMPETGTASQSLPKKLEPSLALQPDRLEAPPASTQVEEAPQPPTQQVESSADEKGPIDMASLRKLPPRTDSGNAELFAALDKDKVRYDHRQGRWLIWDIRRSRWKEDAKGEIRRLAKQAARYRYRAALRIDDEGQRKWEAKWAIGSEDRYRIEAALELAKSEHPVSDSGEGWDAVPWQFGVANGIVDLHSGKLREGTQQDRLTKFSPVRFDAGATCPRWVQFLNEIFQGDAELVRYVQKAVGYSLTGSVREQCLFACWGSGANGKTTFLEALLHIAGDYGIDLPFSALEMKRNGNMPGEAVNLLGARFAKSVEVREGKRLDEARIKALTGGDTISVRPLYRNAFSFKPTHKHWLAFNDKPVIADDSPAMWRRIRLIPFQATFEGQRDDKELPDKLKAEASGILNWAIEGCLLWQKEGLGMPSAVAQATADYRAESDHLDDFLEDCCFVETSATVTSGALWGQYRQWASENEEVPITRKAFGERLEKRGFRRGRSGHGGTHTWTGIGLIESTCAQPLNDSLVHGDRVTEGDAISRKSPIEEGARKVTESASPHVTTSPATQAACPKDAPFSPASPPLECLSEQRN